MVKDIQENSNGTLVWDNAEVIKILEDGKPDEEKDIRKLIKKEGK